MLPPRENGPFGWMPQTRDKQNQENELMLTMDGPPEAKGTVEIDGSTSAEVNINGKLNEIMTMYILQNKESHFSKRYRIKKILQNEPELEYAYEICMGKKCLNFGHCSQNLCNQPEKLVKMAKAAELSKSSVGTILGALVSIFAVVAFGFVLYIKREYLVDLYNKNIIVLQ